MPRTSAVLLIVCASIWVLLAGRSTAGSIVVTASGDLQRALDAASPGDEILLQPGATYVGNFVLPPRSTADMRVITLRTSGAESVPEGRRILPSQAASLAKLRSPNNLPALATSPTTRFWKIELIEFPANKNGAGDIITLGDGGPGQSSYAQMPSDLVLDRLYVHGDPSMGQKRGIALNSSKTTISNSYIADIKAVGQDSQAICGWNGSGDYLIENNYLEAAGENVLFGGADPPVLNLTPERITIRGNTMSKPEAWHAAGQPWQVKNLFELKNARSVIVERNLFERNWQAGQAGDALAFTPRNQDGACPWCVVEDIQFRQNIVRDVAAGLTILGTDYIHPSLQTNRVVISDNLFDGIDSSKWGGDGYFMLITDNPRDITIDHNTVIQGVSNGIAQIEGQIEHFVFTNNLIARGMYGLFGPKGEGNPSIAAALPGSTITANVLAGASSSLYPVGNLFPSLDEFHRQFVNFSDHDYRLAPASRWVRAGLDGRDLGATLAPMTSRSPTVAP